MPYIINRNNYSYPDTYNAIDNKVRYVMNDLKSVYSHYNPKTGRNEITENKLPERSVDDGKSKRKYVKK